jgi:hypothetical protein
MQRTYKKFTYPFKDRKASDLIISLVEFFAITAIRNLLILGEKFEQNI